MVTTVGDLHPRSRRDLLFDDHTEMRILSFKQPWLAQELRELGHEVVTCGHAPSMQVQIPKRIIPIQEVLQLVGGFSPDILLFLDDSMSALSVSGLDTCDIPSLFYSVDTHHHYEIHTQIAALFDHVLVAQQDYIHRFQRCGTPVTWFPPWAPRRVEPHHDKCFGAAFVGTLDVNLNPRRVNFFNALSKRIPIHVTSGDYADVFPFAEIVVNQTVKGDLNFRIFEAMMCGALLITERTHNGLFDLFKEGEHLVTYEADNIEEVVERCAWLRSQPKRLREIAHAGREEILTRHTSMHRAAALDKILRPLTRRAARPDRHYVSMINTAHANRTLSSVGQPPCIHATESGLRAAEDALKAGSLPSERETTVIILTCGLFDQLTNQRVGADLIRRFYEKFSDNPLLAFARIHSLIKKGAMEEAHRVAAQRFNIPPDQSISIALDLIPRIVRGEIYLAPE